MPHPVNIIDLGVLKQPLHAPEIHAAANVAFSKGFHLAKLSTPEGGELFIVAKPSLETLPVKLTITGPVCITASAHHPLIQDPVHPRCVARPDHMRPGVFTHHFAQ